MVIGVPLLTLTTSLMVLSWPLLLFKVVFFFILVLQCIERNVNNLTEYASSEFMIMSMRSGVLIKRVLQTLLYFEDCRVNPL